MQFSRDGAGRTHSKQRTLDHHHHHFHHLLYTLIYQAAEEWSEFVLMIREVTSITIIIITIVIIIVIIVIIIICMKYWVKTKNAQVMVRDSGDYECQVSGPNHTSISKLVSLTVIGETTT